METPELSQGRSFHSGQSATCRSHVRLASPSTRARVSWRCPSQTPLLVKATLMLPLLPSTTS